MTEAATNEHIFGVGGMTCNGCANNVKNALTSVAGVLNVEIDLDGAKATVQTDGQTEKNTLESAVTNAGYSIHEPGASLDLLQTITTPKPLNIKQKLHHITFIDEIILAFTTQPALIPSL